MIRPACALAFLRDVTHAARHALHLAAENAELREERDALARVVRVAAAELTAAQNKLAAATQHPSTFDEHAADALALAVDDLAAVETVGDFLWLVGEDK